MPVPCEKGCDRPGCLKSHNQVELLFHPDRYKTKFCEKLESCEYGKYCAFAHSEAEIRVRLIHLENDPCLLKTEWCPYPSQKHDPETCFYAHSLLDYRRNPGRHYYRPERCPDWRPASYSLHYSLGGCPRQLRCSFAHSEVEIDMHPAVLSQRASDRDPRADSRTESTQASEHQARREHDTRLYFLQHLKRAGQEHLLQHLP